MKKNSTGGPFITRIHYPVTLVALVALLLLSACTPATPAGAPEDATESGTLIPITLGVGFVPSVQFAPLYVAIDKGYYREAGLDVELEYGYENDYLKLVGTGETSFMIGSGDQVVIGRAQGLPVRYVMKWYTEYPVVVLALEGSGITQPEDLAGRSIGIPGPFGASYVAFRGILEAAGLDESDVQMESIGFTQAPALAEGTVDAAVDYAANGPVVLALEGFDIIQIALDDYLQIPANGIVTNDETIRNQPELVSAVVGATARAIEYTLDNPDEGFEIALKFVPEAGGDNRDTSRAVFDASLEFWRPQSGNPIGESTLSEWQTAAQFIRRIGMVDTDVDAAELYTNEFLP